MLGLGATGKSWILARLRNREISQSELSNIKITNLSKPIKDKVIPVGSYDIIPTYRDTAGGKPGDQINAIFRKYRKSIWVLVWIKPSVELEEVKEFWRHIDKELSFDKQYF